MPQEPIQRGDVYWITYAFPQGASWATIGQSIACQDARGGRQAAAAVWTGTEAPMTDIAILEPEILLVEEMLAVGDAAFQKKC